MNNFVRFWKVLIYQMFGGHVEILWTLFDHVVDFTCTKHLLKSEKL